MIFVKALRIAFYLYEKGRPDLSLSIMERRVYPRLHLTTEQFKLAENHKVYAVIDLSKTGMALRILDPDDLLFFPILREVEGVFNLKREKFLIKARVQNVRRDAIGLSFIGPTQAFKQTIENLLDPKNLGKDLKPITQEDGTLWFHAPSGTDVLVWQDKEGQKEKFTVFILGSYVQWDVSQGIATGRIAGAADTDTVVSGLIRLETMLLEQDQKPDPGKLQIAHTLLAHSKISHDIQSWVIEKVKHG